MIGKNEGWLAVSTNVEVRESLKCAVIKPQF